MAIFFFQAEDGIRDYKVTGVQSVLFRSLAVDRVVVGIGAHFEACIGEDGLVVFPARVGDQHLGGGADLLEEVGADLQAAGAADGLHRGHAAGLEDRKSTRLNSSHLVISYAVFCLKKKKNDT